ncbi:MAG: 16S rRNA (guanine(527)-N(7))-methyltransferase RsmG [Pseudomonadota bacterium]
MQDGPEILSEHFDVSRETSDRLRTYVDLVRKWQNVQNLVAPSTLPDIWRRHVLDSAQILRFAPHARRWLDFGSGAGFPGLVVSILLADRPGFHAHLVESNGRKAAFLRAVVREIGLPATIHDQRIERFAWTDPFPVDVISARALAALPVLCDYAEPFMSEKTVAIFHKGRDTDSELNSTLSDWILDLVIEDSVVDPQSRLLVIRALQRSKTG